MIPVRRIVADFGADGLSRVVLDESVPLEGEPERIRLTNVWIAPMARGPNGTPFDGGFVPSCVSERPHRGRGAFAGTRSML